MTISEPETGDRDPARQPGAGADDPGEDPGRPTRSGFGEGRTVLVVDDDWISRSVLVRMLESDGYTVRAAQTAHEGFGIARAEHIDAFLLDIRMPGMGGIELCRGLRGIPAYRSAPILFVTALDEPANLNEAFDAGCDDFINKPVNPVILKARLMGHLQKAEYYDQLERVRRNLARYISPRTQEMVEAYSVTGELPPPQEKELCIFFSDIRGFTELSQAVDPDELFSLLSRHLAEHVDLVYRYGGYVDKYSGDGVMAVFDGEGMAARACRCALDVVDAAAASHVEGNDGTPVMRPRIGIHRGSALIGNIGSSEHLDYSVVGESVNLAARLCGYAGPMTVVVSRSVREAAAGDDGLAFPGEQEVYIRGFAQPVGLYRLARNSGRGFTGSGHLKI